MDDKAEQIKEVLQEITESLPIVQEVVAVKEQENTVSKKEEKPQLALIKVVEIVLNRRYSFRRNIITNQTECKEHGTEKYVRANEDTIHRYVQHCDLNKFKLADLKSLFRSDFVQEYDPFIEYFTGLPQWDGKTDYIDKLASYVTADEQSFWNVQLKKYMVRAIRCALEPGVPNRTVLVLFGGQNSGKSWFLRFINPLKAYYSEAPIRDNKDSFIRLSENFWVNMEELSDMNNLEVNRLKMIISLAWVKERRPYAAEEVAIPRRCNFVGATNKTEFLIDTSNSRWIIIKVSKIDFNYSKEFKIDDAWAQAYALYQDKTFKCDLTIEEQQERDAVNEEFELISPEHDAVVRFMKPCKPDDTEAEFLTKAEILDYLHLQTMLTVMGTGGGFQDAREIINPIKLNQYGVRNALTKEGFIGGKKYINKKQHRGHFLIKVPFPEVTDTLPQNKVFDEKDFFQPQTEHLTEEERLQNNLAQSEINDNPLRNDNE